jgi:glycosyltransferase involved in cell wall biosynthesis
MTKVVIYSHYFAPSVGGVETSVMSLATGLATQFKITVVTNTAPGAFDDQALPFSVVRTPGVVRLLKLISECDILHIAGPALLPLLIARAVSRPAVVEHHGYQAACPNGVLLKEPGRTLCVGHFMLGEYKACIRCQHASSSSYLASLRSLILTILRRSLCKSAKNIAISKHVLMRHQLLNMQVIYYGVRDPFEATSVTTKQKPSQKVRFAYVGRFVLEKGIPVFLKAAQECLNRGLTFDLLLIGDGPERTNIEQQIRELGLGRCATITGFLRGQDLESAMDSIHVVVMPSVWEETAGLSAIEHMMRGRLVIASAIGGLGEMVGDGGLTFPPGDPRSLAEIMTRVIENPELIVHLGGAGRTRAVTYFGHLKMLSEHANLYRTVLGFEESA